MKLFSLFATIALLATACSSSQKEGSSASEQQDTEQAATDMVATDENSETETQDADTEEAPMSNEETGAAGSDADKAGNDAKNSELSAAQAELADFAKNISLEAENNSKRLLSKYEYDLVIDNSNSVLSVQKVKIKVEYFSKKHEDLGGTYIQRDISIKPGDTGKIYWSVDWIKLKDGTKECKFSIESVESNIAEFEQREA